MLATIVLGAMATGCATTYDASEATTIPSSTSTTVPTGPTAELLQRLLAEAAKLGTLIDEHSTEATPTVARVEALWHAARADVEGTHPGLLDDLDLNVEGCRSAVTRNRPADADKAFRNLTVLVDSYDGG